MFWTFNTLEVISRVFVVSASGFEIFLHQSMVQRDVKSADGLVMCSLLTAILCWRFSE